MGIFYGQKGTLIETAYYFFLKNVLFKKILQQRYAA